MKKLVILFFLFVGLAIFVYYYEIEGEPKREEAKKLEESLFRLKQDEIASLEVVRAGQEPVVLKKEGENWVLKAPVEAAADSSTLDSLLRNIETARIERTFPEGGGRAEEYGLKEPRLTLKVGAQGKEKVLLVGNDEYTGTQIYAQFQNDSKVYLTSDSLFTTADKDVMQWRNKKVLAFERDQVRAVEIERGAEKIALKKEGDQWALTSPLQEGADRDTVSGLLSALELAEAQAFVAEKAQDLGPYGLDKPGLRVRIQEEGQERWKTLEIGKKKESDYLVRNPDRLSVFTVKEDVYQKLTQKLWEFRDKDVVDLQQDQVAKLHIRRGGEEIVLRHEDYKWMIEKPEAQKDKEALSYKFWYPIDDIKFESIEEASTNGPAAFAKPAVQVVATLKDDSTRTYEFVQKGDRYLARRVDSRRQGTISKESFEKLRFKVEEIV